MQYVHGFAAAVPDENRDTYRKFSAQAAEVFKEYGALRCVECWGVDVPEGKITSFPMAVQRKDGETVVFSWIIWPSKEEADKGMQEAMKDSRLSGLPMPFDGKRIIWGGFEVLIDV